MMKKLDKSSIETANGSVSRRIKIMLINAISVILFLVILGLCSLPTIFYYTADQGEAINGTLLRSITKQSILYNRSCNKPLIVSNGSQCVPQCSWRPWNERQNWEIKGTTFSACILAILSIIVVLLTWVKIPQLWKFPNFIVVIMLAESTIIVTLVSVGMLLGDDVFCSSKFLPVAVKTPTVFCKFQGTVLHYLSGSIALWFVVYNITIAKALVYDKININRSKEKWPFLVSALVSCLLPVIPVLFVYNSHEGYASFYSTYCFPGSIELTYYSAILPENISFAIGVSFLYIVIWKLLKERNASVTASAEQEQHRKNKMANIVIRLTLLMICYAITMYLTYGSMAYILNKTPAFETATKKYFHCLMSQPNCPFDYNRYMFHIPILLNYVAAAIFPVSTVLFLAANEKARRLWKNYFTRLQYFISKHEESRATSVTHLVNEDERHRELMYGTYEK